MSANPYEQPGWGEQFRPGGPALTRRLLTLSGLAPGTRILDVGCGTGDACALLWEAGYDAAGLDPSQTLIGRGRARHPGLPLTVGEAAAPPFPPASRDALLFECVLSELDAPAALAGCVPLLRPGGLLLLSDLYARVPSPILPTRDQWEALLRAHGLLPLGFEDQSRALGSFLAQKLMDGADLEGLLCRPLSDFRAAKAGYFLLWARLKGDLLS